MFLLHIFLCIIPLIIYVFYIRSYRFKIKEMAVIGIFAALSYILSLINVIHYPQGGSTIFHVMAGVIFFSELAPKGVSSLIYSLVYNFSGTGVEGIISAIVMGIFPIERIKNNRK